MELFAGRIYAFKLRHTLPNWLQENVDQFTLPPAECDNPFPTSSLAMDNIIYLILMIIFDNLIVKKDPNLLNSAFFSKKQPPKIFFY